MPLHEALYRLFNLLETFALLPFAWQVKYHVGVLAIMLLLSLTNPDRQELDTVP